MERTTRPLLVPAALVAGSVAVLAAAIATGGSTNKAAGVVVLATLAAVMPFLFVGWPRVLAVLILTILFVPIRRYSLPGNLPFELEPYRVFVAALLLGWFASLLADPRSRLRKTGFEGPLILIVGSALASIATNPDRVAQLSPIVDKKLMFFLSFVLVLYVAASTIRRLADIDYLAKTLVIGGAIVGLFAMIEASTGFNVFNHLDRCSRSCGPAARASPRRSRSSARRGCGCSDRRSIRSRSAPPSRTDPARHLPRSPLPPAPLAACTVLLVAGCSATVSRTGVVMLVVVALVFLWLRPREIRRLWPASSPR